jgi:hypothetical protein
VPTYRLEAWIQHKEYDFEDELEERVRSAFKGEGIGVSAGPVVFRIFPCGAA